MPENKLTIEILQGGVVIATHAVDPLAILDWLAERPGRDLRLAVDTPAGPVAPADLHKRLRGE